MHAAPAWLPLAQLLRRPAKYRNVLLLQQTLLAGEGKVQNSATQHQSDLKRCVSQALAGLERDAAHAEPGADVALRGGRAAAAERDQGPRRRSPGHHVHAGRRRGGPAVLLAAPAHLCAALSLLSAAPESLARDTTLQNLYHAWLRWASASCRHNEAGRKLWACLSLRLYGFARWNG